MAYYVSRSRQLLVATQRTLAWRLHHRIHPSRVNARGTGGTMSGYGSTGTRGEALDARAPGVLRRTGPARRHPRRPADPPGCLRPRRSGLGEDRRGRRVAGRPAGPRPRGLDLVRGDRRERPGVLRLPDGQPRSPADRRGPGPRSPAAAGAPPRSPRRQAGRHRARRSRPDRVARRLRGTRGAPRGGAPRRPLRAVQPDGAAAAPGQAPRRRRPGRATGVGAAVPAGRGARLPGARGVARPRPGDA